MEGETVDTGIETAVVDTGAEVNPPVDGPSNAPGNDPQVETAGEDNPQPDYTPNFKYNAYGEEKEMDEWARGLINKENEENFRKLFAGQAATEKMSGKLQSMTESHDQLRNSWDGLTGRIETLRGHVQNGDFDKFFEGLNIPQQLIFQYVLEKLKYNDMSQEDRAAYDNSLALKRQNLELQNQNRGLVATSDQVVVDQRNFALDVELAKPEVNQIMQEYDRAAGQVGAFRREIIARGAQEYYATGQDLPADKAVARVVQMLTWRGNPAAPNPGAVATPPGAGRAQERPVIPNVRGKSTSPTMKSPRSLDDLRKMAAAKLKENAAH